MEKEEQHRKDKLGSEQLAKDHSKSKVGKDSTEYKLSKLKVEGRFISWNVKLDSLVSPSRFTGHILNDRMEGMAHDLKIHWDALKIGVLDKEDEKTEEEHRSELSVFYPEGTYGLEDPQLESQTVLIQNTTVWTCGNQGILEGVDILFKSGKVKEIGKNLNKPKGILEIDGFGKHIGPQTIRPPANRTHRFIDGLKRETAPRRIGLRITSG